MSDAARTGAGRRHVGVGSRTRTCSCARARLCTPEEGTPPETPRRHWGPRLTAGPNACHAQVGRLHLLPRSAMVVYREPGITVRPPNASRNSFNTVEGVTAASCIAGNPLSNRGALSRFHRLYVGTIGEGIFRAWTAAAFSAADRMFVGMSRWSCIRAAASALPRSSDCFQRHSRSRRRPVASTASRCGRSWCRRSGRTRCYRNLPVAALSLGRWWRHWVEPAVARSRRVHHPYRVTRLSMQPTLLWAGVEIDGLLRGAGGHVAGGRQGLS